MKKRISFLRIVLKLMLVLSLMSGLVVTSSAVAFNQVLGRYEAGGLTGYVFGDFVSDGEISGIGYVDPWSYFEWLEDGETIRLAYAGPSISTAGTGFEGMGAYGYLGTAQIPQSTDMADMISVLFGTTDRDVRIYFFNEKNQPIDVSFHIQSISNMAFGGHSVACVVTPEGRIELDQLDPESMEQNLAADLSFTLEPYQGTPIEVYPGDNGVPASKRPADDPDTGYAPAGCFYISLTSQPNLGNDPSAGVVISNFFAGGENDTMVDITLEATA